IWCWRVIWSRPSFARGKTSGVPAPLNRCDAGCTHCCRLWAPRLTHPNLVENRQVASKGPRFARHHAFRSCARRPLCLNLFQGDRLTSFFIPYGSFYGTFHEVLLLPVSLNVKISWFFHKT